MKIKTASNDYLLNLSEDLLMIDATETGEAVLVAPEGYENYTWQNKQFFESNWLAIGQATNSRFLDLNEIDYISPYFINYQFRCVLDNEQSTQSATVYSFSEEIPTTAASIIPITLSENGVNYDVVNFANWRTRIFNAFFRLERLVGSSWELYNLLGVSGITGDGEGMIWSSISRPPAHFLSNHLIPYFPSLNETVRLRLDLQVVTSVSENDGTQFPLENLYVIDNIETEIYYSNSWQLNGSNPSWIQKGQTLSGFIGKLSKDGEDLILVTKEEELVQSSFCLKKLEQAAQGTDGISFYCAGPDFGGSPCCLHSRDPLLDQIMGDPNIGSSGIIYGSSNYPNCFDTSCFPDMVCESCEETDLSEIPSDWCICPPIPERNNPEGCECQNGSHSIVGENDYLYINYNSNINSNSANYNNCANSVTTVGSNGGPSYYGTYDQSGNVYEWNDMDGQIIIPYRIFRGGAYSSSLSDLSSYIRSGAEPSNKSNNIGFRIASLNNSLNISNFVNVEDINNINDLNTGDLYGGVDYSYKIAKYPVTNCEYALFLNAVASTDTYNLYNTNSGITRKGSVGNYNYFVKANMGNKPVVYTSWFDAARYCNWLHNGKPSGNQDNSTTENGAYTLNGAISGDAVAKNVANYYIPTENEWYKAAHYAPNKNSSNKYYLYSTQSDNDPTCVQSDTNGDGPLQTSYVHTCSEINIFNFVKIYNFQEEEWIQKGNSIPVSKELVSVDISKNGNFIIIGYPTSNIFKVFEWNESDWIQKGSNISGSGNFGFSVSINNDGKVVAVGSPLGNVAKVYKWLGSTENWIKKGQDIIIENIEDKNGYDVSLSGDGNILSVSAPSNSNNKGLVHIYKWVEGSWVQKGNNILGESAGDFSGNSISLNNNGEVLIIGDPNNNNKGQARVYRCTECHSCEIEEETDSECPTFESCCWKIPLSTEGGIKEIGIPKYINLDFKMESICYSTYLQPDPWNESGFFELCAFQPPGINGGDCFSGCPCGLESGLFSTTDISPSFEIETEDEESSIRVQVWESDNDEDCEECEELINPRWLTQGFKLKISGCDNDTENSYEITFSENGYQITGQSNFFTCELPPVCGLDIGSADPIRAPENYSILISGSNWQTRYRREYNDYTLSETQMASSNLAKNRINDFTSYPDSVRSKFTLNSEPTCRAPDTDQFCGCFDESLYNLINLEDLDSYDMPLDGCDGRPLDIDIVCGKSGFDSDGDVEIEGGIIMYYSPYSNTVPVINNIAYDVFNLPDPPPGKINVIKIHETLTRNQMRIWTCENLKFATVRDDWRTNPIIGSGTIGSDFSNPQQNVNFNWPYNDLYFSDGCEGGDTVNLIPC